MYDEGLTYLSESLKFYPVILSKNSQFLKTFYFSFGFSV